jgi:hypothetical protein
MSLTRVGTGYLGIIHTAPVEGIGDLATLAAS